MMTKKRTIIISLVIVVVSLFVFTITLFLGDSFMGIKEIEWVKTISAGALTSALVTLLVSVSEYKTEKRKAIEAFFDASCALIYHYRNSRDLHTEIPLGLLSAYFLEEKRASTGLFEHDEKPKQDILDYLWNHLQTEAQKEIEEKDHKPDYLSQAFSRTLERDREAISAVVTQYTNIAESVSTRELTMAFGGIDFMFANKRVRGNLIYTKMYEAHRNAYAKVKELAYHLKECRPDAESVTWIHPVIISKILETQQSFLEIVADDYSVRVYNRFEYDIDCAGYELLRYLYRRNYKEEKPKKEDYLKTAYMHRVVAEAPTDSLYTRGNNDGFNSK